MNVVVINKISEKYQIALILVACSTESKRATREKAPSSITNDSSSGIHYLQLVFNSIDSNLAGMGISAGIYSASGTPADDAI